MSTLLTCTSSTRPGSPAAGDTLFETDTNRVIVYSGTAWKEYQDNGQLYNDSDITALSPHIWLDGAGGYFYDDELKTSLVSNHGQDVGTWADRSGNGFDFTQATASSRPTIINNFGVTNKTFLLYDGDQLSFTGTTSSEISGSGSTMFFVLHFGVVSGDYILISSDLSTRIKATASTTLGTLFFNCQNYAGTSSNNSYLQTDANDVLSYKVGIVAFRFGASLADCFVNGTTQTDTETNIPTGTLFTDTVTYDLFDTTVGPSQPNMLGEYMVYDSALSDTDMNTVTNYLGKKYGITVATL